MSANDTTDDPARLAALAACQVLDTGRETAFDNIAFTAAQMFRVPWARITLVDANRVWAKANVGTLPIDTPRNETLCRFVVETRRLLVIDDTMTDARFAQLPAVAREPYIRFFAGAPVIAPGNFVVGALCVLDRLPRTIAERQQALLMQLAHEAGELLRLRTSGVDLSA